MGIILFLVDTSASMNQKTYLGASYLDVAKVAIETFMKYRSREPNSRYDRYMLVSFDEPTNCVKAGWKTSNAAFISQLKNLQATSLSTFGQSLKESFDLLNIHRLHTSIDHYGQGRNPFFLEPAVIIALTDGGRITDVDNEFVLPVSPNPPEGSELTNQPFRWDQRLFTVLLRLPGIGEERNSAPNETIENEYILRDASVSSMCERTGGKSYVVTNQKSLAQCMESLTQKLQPGVVINFQKIRGKTPNGEQEAMEVDGEQNGNLNGMTGDNQRNTPVPNGESTGTLKNSNVWHNTRKMIYVKNNVSSGFWPVPESFWPDDHTVTLPPRDVHPVVWFDTTDVSPMLVEKFPFDKYELEPSPLTQCILGKRNSNICWQVYVSNSGKQEGITHPFGYLKASSSLTHVTLFVMPYNYRELLPLAEDLLNNRLRPPPQWRQKFNDYISSVPSYYAPPLRKAFNLMGTPSNLIPDSFDGQMSFTISNYLRKLKKQAKLESERVMGNTYKRMMETTRRGSSIIDVGDGISLAIGSTLKDEAVTSQSFCNPFDICRSGLLGQLARMRTNFFRATPTTPNLTEEAVRHQIPIGQMGNYQEHLKKMNPLRELDEAGGLRTQLFGNPYKLERSSDKAGGKVVESADMDIFADEHMVEMNRKPSVRGGGGRRRTRLRSYSPYPSRPATPPQATTPSSNTDLTSNHLASSNNNERQTEKSSEGRQKDVSSPLTKEAQNKNPTPPRGDESAPQLKQQSSVEASSREPHAPILNSHPEPFKSSCLPEDKSNTLSVKTSLEKVHQSRKRERTPSPTPYPNPKRQSSERDVSSKLTSTAQILRSVSGGGTNHVSGRGGKGDVSSASRVLNEELQKQQGQENAKLKLLISKEVRKQGKNYDTIFLHLDEVRGSLEIRDTFVSEVIREAGKFKRKKLVQELEEWRSSLKNARTPAASANKSKPPPPVKR